jgi:translation initiation factor IF-2
MQKENVTTSERPPIVAVMGHIDHGKSTLLSYIRKSSKPLNEAGGITQHISAYEVEHKDSSGKIHKITFIDTPGHEAFSGIRRRGASVADIAILVVSAEDGVKPQTVEALSSILASQTPYIVAINKIDKAGANVEKTKQNLIENEIYLEGYGGNIPYVPLSAKTGEGVPELLDMITLVSEVEELKGDSEIPGEGMIIESNRDIKKGISATCIIKNGNLKKGMYVVSGTAITPVRIMENYLGKSIDVANIGSPVKLIGWDIIPEVGNTFKAYSDRKEAEAKAEEEKIKAKSAKKSEDLEEGEGVIMLPLIVKADTASSLEAVSSEIKKISTDKIRCRIISSGIGSISESDVRVADGTQKAIIIGFNTKVDSPAKNLAERNEIEIKDFDIIYKMIEWLKGKVVEKTPKMKTVESLGTAKILKIFSKVKDKQILGGRVEKGVITLGSQVKIMRRDAEIGEGKIRELQQAKVSTKEIEEGREFGALIEAKIEIAPGDRIDNFIIVEK